MALSEYELQRQLDKTKAAVFRRGDAAFFAPLLCSLKFRWRDDIPTAQTDGEYLDWSPEDFEKCTQEEREATLMHELWHVADMDLLRRGDREPKRWNIACDLRNNRRLIEDGYKIEKSPMFIHDPRITETLKEKIYEKLPNMPPPPPMGGGGGSGSGGGSGHKHGPRCQHHLMNPNKGAIIGNVAQAIQSAKASGDPGSVPGSLEELIKQFTAPVVPWEVYLERWMTDLRDYDYTWSKRNRRYPNMYLPSMFMDEGRLDHLRYYIDSSGSITTGDLKCMNGEIKYIWDILKPKKLTIVMFDTVIHQVIELKEGDEFEQIKIVGRGGTNLVQVRDDIIKHNPTAAIIFTDLHVSPMKKLPFDIPILWICSNNKRGTVPFGDIIHVDTRKRK